MKPRSWRPRLQEYPTLTDCFYTAMVPIGRLAFRTPGTRATALSTMILARRRVNQPRSRNFRLNQSQSHLLLKKSLPSAGAL